jgi:hypothetical protein
LPSRSRIKNRFVRRNQSTQSIRFLATGFMKSSSGWGVLSTMVTARVARLMTKEVQVLVRHPDAEFGDARHHEPAIRLPTRQRPTLRDELPVPAQDRVGRDDRGGLVKESAAEDGTSHRQPYSLVGPPHQLPSKLIPSPLLALHEARLRLLS